MMTERWFERTPAHRSPEFATDRLLAGEVDPAAARRFVRSALADWSDESSRDDVVLLASELVASVAAGSVPTLSLRVTVDPLGARIMVRGSRSTWPNPFVLGRGEPLTTQIVDAVADTWGTAEHEDGLTVWCRVGARVARPRPPRRPSLGGAR